MGLLLAFLPFIGFALATNFIGPVPGLVCGALIALVFLLRDWLSPGRSVKALEIGTFILFSALAAYALMGRADMSILGVRLCIDAGLLLIVLVTMAIRLPFTLQYAREQTPQNLWNRPEFIRANYTISAIWAAAFAIMVFADLLLLYVPNVPPHIGILATVVGLVGAIRFSTWYPQRLRARFQEGA